MPSQTDLCKCVSLIRANGINILLNHMYEESENVKLLVATHFLTRDDTSHKARYTHTHTREICGLWRRRWKSERERHLCVFFMCFATVFCVCLGMRSKMILRLYKTERISLSAPQSSSTLIFDLENVRKSSVCITICTNCYDKYGDNLYANISYAVRFYMLWDFSCRLTSLTLCVE